ncbi:MAG: twin-arginine translocase TatA/TatE family subunit [bacterium]|nr:twin-arginine translocase TatA/TatE family subunit [bacterium]MBU1916517.1 twin-arginine translocase TatA/TatE family subunit [bacterium]
MFGISFAEILIVVVIAFLVVGPKKMGDVLFQAGKFWQKFQNEWGDLNISNQLNKITKIDLDEKDEKDEKLLKDKKLLKDENSE